MLGREEAAAVETGARAAELAERFGQRALQSRALNAIGSARWLSDPEEAERVLVRSLEVARRSGDDGMIGVALVNLGSGAGEARLYATAERWLHEAIDWCSRRDLDSMRRYATAWLARCLFERGEWQQADELISNTEVLGHTCSTIVRLTVLGRLRTRRGEPGAAQALDEAYSLAAKTGELQYIWPAAAARAELSWLNGEPHDPRLPGAYRLAVRLGHGWAIGELGQWLEQPEAGGFERAAAPYLLGAEASARAWDEIGCPYESAMALASSEEHWAQALARLERLGARPAADRLARLGREDGRRPPRRSTLAHPHGLTERQADVLDLLGEGLRNAEIAARLHITAKTVDHHVSAILAKLGVASRREAARYVH
jgi:DNA-binding CsgD family transcriptional regulator